jgi:hypothetical protein
MVSATSGNWGATWSNFEAFNSGTNINATGGLVCSQDSSGNWNCNVDSTVVAFLSALNATATSVGSYSVLSMTSGTPGLATSAGVVGLFGGGSCTGFLKSDGTCTALAATNLSNVQNAITLTGTPTAAISFSSVAIPVGQCLDLTFWGSFTSSISGFYLNLYIAGSSVLNIISNQTIASGVLLAKTDNGFYAVDRPTIKICSGTSANDIVFSSLDLVTQHSASNLIFPNNEVTSNTVNLAAGATIALYVQGSGTMTLSANLK